MPKFVVERNMPGAGSLTTEQLAALSQVSCQVVFSMGSRIQWVESFVTDNKLYCIYLAEDESVVREHARLSQLPADSINLVRCVIDSSCAEIGDA